MQPFLPYRGGKSKIAKKIVSILPPHRVYVEPMVGGGSVFFAKEPAPKEVISDLDRSLMGFYRALKRGEVKRCDLSPDRDRLRRIQSKRKAGADLSPCDYLYFNKLSFGGKGHSYDVAAFREKCLGDKARTCNVASKDHVKYAERLNKAVLEQGDFRAVMRRHDGPETVHYLDPPYAGTSTEGYRHRDLQPEQVKDALRGIRGKVVLSYNDTPQVRNLFCGRENGYKCRTVDTKYTLNNGGNWMGKKELLITNFLSAPHGRCRVPRVK